VELIVTEKDDAARRIADILSEGAASVERRNGVNVYRWGDRRCVGLSGHVVGVDFPPEYSDWRDVQPVELVGADVVKTPTQENIVRTLEELAGAADEAVIATDYDREGELIGKEAHELIDSVTDVPTRRVRFSSITQTEVTDAFAHPDDLDFDLAAAGEARQVIDLLWGAALTRFLSLSAGRLGEDFISVGRVQSPTLKLIVDREREIRAFEPDDYWELFADLGAEEAFEAQYFHREDGTETERVWEEAAAEAVHADLTEAGEAVVRSVNRRRRTDAPPEPFDTTAYISAAGSLGLSAQRAMSVAEELYTAGYVTYPRTDNTVYPDDLDPAHLLESFVGHHPFDEDAQTLLDGDVEPTAGDEETTDHPPIHPTGEVPGRQELSDDEWRVYELVVRRFFATVADAAEWEHLKVVSAAGDRLLKANGKRLVEPGYHAVYPYGSTAENYVPAVEEGDVLDVSDVRLEAKETQPPRRRGQSRLIEEMAGRGLGTKCVTEDTDVLVQAENGDIERRTVRELFDSQQVVLADGETDVAATTGGPLTLSYEERTGRTKRTRSELVSRRSLATDERILEIETELGTFSVTDEHPLYVRTDGETSVLPAEEVEPGQQLLATRNLPMQSSESGDTVLTWGEFAAECDWSSKLFGIDCNDSIRKTRRDTGETQSEFAERIGTRRSYISAYENDHRDVPVWILGELDIRPDRLHGLNYDTTVDNPFPLAWSEVLARLLGHLLGDGSIHVNEEENVVDVRYHNTDRQLIESFATDIESLFGVYPTISEREGRESHHRTRYQVNLSAAVGRLVVRILDAISEKGCPNVSRPYRPAFIGALFDDEGHVSREQKAFIANTDHELLRGVGTMLAAEGVDTKIAPTQHKLHIRGRPNLRRFLDLVPLASPEKFYRGLDGLRRYDVTHRKAEVLELASQRPCTSQELANELGLSTSSVQAYLRELREEGYIEMQKQGSNRGEGDNRKITYVGVGFHGSIYATLLGYPATATVLDIDQRDYCGPVFDLSVDDVAPNFAIEGGIIVHNSTRHNTLQKLYDRGYVEGDPPRPTALAEAVVEAAEEFAEQVVTDEMTAQLEADMNAIAEGEKTLGEVTEESRAMLERVFENLRESREDIGEHIQESLKADSRLGPCPECGENLLVRQSGDGSHFVGCDGYPDCQFTLPLPNTGRPLVLDSQCDQHDLQHVKMLAGRDTFVHGCPRCAAAAAEETEDRVIGGCPDCGDEHGGDLAIKQLRSGSRLVGCTRYPDCEYSLPLPRRGDIEVVDERCGEHDLPGLVVQDGDDEPWELGCPICNYQEYRREQAVNDLEDIDGIGERTVEKLAAAGVDSPDELDTADPERLAGELQGVSADRLREWQAELAG